MFTPNCTDTLHYSLLTDFLIVTPDCLGTLHHWCEWYWYTCVISWHYHWHTVWHQTVLTIFVSQCWHKYHLLFDTRLYWQISLVSADTNIIYVWHQTIVTKCFSQCWHKYNLLFDTKLYWQISLVSADTNITFGLTPNYTDKCRYSLLTQNMYLFFDTKCTDKFHYSPLTQISLTVWHQTILTNFIIHCWHKTFIYCLTPNLLTNFIIHCWHKYHLPLNTKCLTNFVIHCWHKYHLLFDTKYTDKFHYSLQTQISLSDTKCTEKNDFFTTDKKISLTVWHKVYSLIFSLICHRLLTMKFGWWFSNKNNGYLELLTSTGPKRLHIP